MAGELGYISYLIKTPMAEFLNEINTDNQRETMIVAEEGVEFATATTAGPTLAGELTNLDQQDVFVHTCAPDRALKALANALYWSGKESFGAGSRPNSQRAPDPSIPIQQTMIDKGYGEAFRALRGDQKIDWLRRAWISFGLFFAFMNLRHRSWRRYSRVVEYYAGRMGRPAQAGPVLGWDEHPQARDIGKWRFPCVGGACKGNVPIYLNPWAPGAPYQDGITSEEVSRRCKLSGHLFWLDDLGYFKGDQNVFTLWDMSHKDYAHPVSWPPGPDRLHYQLALNAAGGRGPVRKADGSMETHEEFVARVEALGFNMPFMNYGSVAQGSQVGVVYLDPSSYWDLLFGKIDGLYPGNPVNNLLPSSSTGRRQNDAHIREECSIVEYLAKIGPVRFLRELRMDVLLNNHALIGTSGQPINIASYFDGLRSDAAAYVDGQIRTLNDERAVVGVGTELGKTLTTAGAEGANSYVMAAGAAVGAVSVIGGLISRAIHGASAPPCQGQQDAFGDYMIPVTGGGFSKPIAYRCIDGNAMEVSAWINDNVENRYMRELGDFSLIPIFQPLGEPDIECFETMAKNGDQRAKYVMSFFEEASYIRRRDRDSRGALCPPDRPFFYRYTDDTEGCHRNADIGCREGLVAQAHLTGTGDEHPRYDCVCPPGRTMARYAPRADWPGQPAMRCLPPHEDPCGQENQVLQADGRYLCSVSDVQKAAIIDQEVAGLSPDQWMARHTACTPASASGVSSAKAKKPTKPKPPGSRKISSPITDDRQPPAPAELPRCPLTGLLSVMIGATGGLPEGTTVAIDDRAPRAVPADGLVRMVMAPGRYSIRVAGGGRSAARPIEIQPNVVASVSVDLPAPERVEPRREPGEDDADHGRNEVVRHDERKGHAWIPWAAGGVVMVAATVAVAVVATRRAAPADGQGGR